MKVKELIGELEKYNPEAEVTRTDSETIYLSFIGDSIETAGVIFVEPRDYVDDRFSD